MVALMENEVLRVSQSSVAQALAADYFCIYYVNSDNGQFIEYSSSPEYRELGLPGAGGDFTLFCTQHFNQVVYPEDRERFLEDFTREKVLSTLETHRTYTMTFRMTLGDGPAYVHLKVTRMLENEGRNLVVGISSIDEQIKVRAAYEKAHRAFRRAEQDRITYGRVAQALAGDYFSIYVVDLDTESFVEYSSTEQYDELGIEKSGENFFRLSRTNMERVLYPEDRDRFMAVFTKDRILEILTRDGSFTMKYRLMFDDVPVYVSMKATLLDDEDGRHLIIGTNNIDAQMKREQEYQARMADARTRARNDFLANMSHDIRTPMNAIVGYTNIANRNLDSPEKVKDALDKIGSSSHFLLSLINDILDMSKIESGMMQLSEAPCDLSALFRRIEDITALQAAKKNLSASYSYEGIRHFMVRADELRIEQILINIISNAIKYTPEGGSVRLTAEEENLPGDERKRYRLTVSDTGIGIREEYLPHIFESFTREENTRVNRVQGTGLGLAITAKVVELMGGTISVNSRLGEGSEFTVVLDLLPLEQEAPAPAAEEVSAADLTGYRALLVEDNEVNAEIASLLLMQYGMEVAHAENGAEGVLKVKEAAEGYYSVVLMDIQMPVMNGYEAARAIRELPGAYSRKLPIIAMSANAYEEDVRDCLAAGMNAHVAKPFDPDTLAALLHRYVSAED